MPLRPPPLTAPFTRCAAVATLAAVALTAPAAEQAGQVALYAPGMPPRIYVRQDAEEERAVAAGMAAVLGAMAAAEAELTPTASADAVSADRPAIVLGSLAEDLGLRIREPSRAGDAFRYALRGNLLLMVAESPRGLAIGAHDFLRSLGCGWYAPGAAGEVLPRREALLLAAGLDHAGSSDSIHRRFWYGGKGDGDREWLLRHNGHLLRGSWRHAYFSLVPKKLFDAHPEYFSEIGGERKPRQLCTTHPDVIRIAAAALLEYMKGSVQFVLPAGPNDGGNLCECSNCMKLRTPGCLEPSSGNPSAGSQVFRFASDLADVTSQSFPDKDLGILVYSDYSRVPLKIQRVNPNVFPMIAPIRRCRFHGPGHPLCKTAQLLEEEIRGWAKLSPKLGFYAYNYNLADTLVPFTKIDYYKRLVRVLREAGVRELAWTFESMDSWATQIIQNFLSVRLSWRSDLDIDAELQRFFDGFYGAAAGPMASYWLRIDNAYAATDAHAGSQYALHRVWTDELLAASRRDIQAAHALAANDREREAVAMADAGLVCAERFMQIWKAVGRCDFLAADEAQQALHAHIDAHATGREPSWFHDRYAWGYYKRFMGRTVTDGARILREGGEILAVLPDRWKFRTDPEGAGLRQGWEAPGLDDSAWDTAGTFTQTWADLGLDAYHGDAWYRAQIELPRLEAGTDVRLWFGGFDHNVEVYLNGRLIGEKTGFATPCEFGGLMPHLAPGGRNSLAVRVSAGGLAELGTGGIMMPVLFYRNAAGDAPEKAAAGGVEYEM